MQICRETIKRFVTFFQRPLRTKRVHMTTTHRICTQRHSNLTRKNGTKWHLVYCAKKGNQIAEERLLPKNRCGGNLNSEDALSSSTPLEIVYILFVTTTTRPVRLPTSQATPTDRRSDLLLTRFDRNMTMTTTSWRAAFH